MKKPDGTPWFNTIKLGLACDDCLAKEIQCVHNKRKQRLPPWRPTHRDALVREMMGNGDLANREMGGQVLTHGVMAFKRMFIDKFIARDRYHPRYPIQVLHCAVDPCG